MQAVIAQSAAAHNGPPNVDEMSYEQLMALGERMGKVNTGCSEEQIASLPEYTFDKQGNPFSEVECLVCIEKFALGTLVKKLPCGHAICSGCADKWLSS